MERAKRIFDKAIEWCCIGLMTLMTVLVSYQVIARYFLNRPSAISEVLSRYMFIWMIMLCAAYVFGLREHMNIPFVKDKLPPKGRLFCELAGEVLVMVFGLGVMTVGGYLGAIRQMTQLDSALQISMGFIYAAIPLSGISIVFYFFYNVKNVLAEYRKSSGKREV